MKNLLVTADDYAMSKGVDDGILALMQTGRLTGASCMTASPDWPTAAARLRQDMPAHCALGVHVDFTGFGRMAQPLARLIMQASLRALPRAEVQAEIARQLDLFEQAIGRRPDYIDGHQHVHQLPVIRDALLAEIDTRYPADARPWLRISAVPDAGLKGHIISMLGSAALRDAARRQGVACTDGLTGVYDFQGGTTRFEALLNDWLATAAQPAWRHLALMCHPGASATPGDPLGEGRVAECQVLGSPAFAQLLSRHQLRIADRAEARQMLLNGTPTAC